MPDKTLYEFKGEKLGKGPLVLTVIKHLVATEGITFEELKDSLAPKKFNKDVLIERSGLKWSSNSAQLNGVKYPQ